MYSVNIHQAKTTLSQLIEKTVNGEEVIIAKAGKPLVRLVPYIPRLAKRKAGTLKGKIRVSNDFNDEIESVLGLFYQDQHK